MQRFQGQQKAVTSIVQHVARQASGREVHPIAKVPSSKSHRFLSQLPSIHGVCNASALHPPWFFWAFPPWMMSLDRANEASILTSTKHRASQEQCPCAKLLCVEENQLYPGQAIVVKAWTIHERSISASDTLAEARGMESTPFRRERRTRDGRGSKQPSWSRPCAVTKRSSTTHSVGRDARLHQVRDFRPSRGTSFSLGSSSPARSGVAAAFRPFTKSTRIFVRGILERPFRYQFL